MMRALFVAALGAACAAELPKIAYLIVAHDEATLRSASLLLDAIYDPENLYLVHVDAKHKWTTKKDEAMKPFTKNRSNVQWAQRTDVRWGRWSMNEPTLWGMREALRSPVDWDVFINLSGDTWPVLTPLSTRKTLAAIKHLNFMTSAPSCPTGLRPTGRQEFGDGWHKKQAYPHPMLGDVPDLEAFYGSQWMILSRAFARHVVDELDAPGTVAREPAWKSTLRPDFSVSDGFDASSSAVLRERDESARFVPKSAESTFDPQTGG